MSTPAPPAPAPSTFGAGKPSNADPLSALTDHLADSVADRVAARLAEQPRPDSTPTTKPGKLALSKAEAAEALGMSVDHLERHVLPDLRVVRSGRLRLVPVSELEAWLDRSAARALTGAPLAHEQIRPHSKAVSESAQGKSPCAPDLREAA